MKPRFLTVSALAIIIGAASCSNNAGIEDVLNQHKQELEFLRDAIRHRSEDVQKVDIIGNSVVYTHIVDGIIDVKTYTYDGDICVEVERVYTFPNQKSALRHYRRAVEQADLYDDITMFGNEVRYNLKEVQHKLETKGLTKEQLKDKFEKQIAAAKKDADAEIKKAEACCEDLLR